MGILIGLIVAMVLISFLVIMMLLFAHGWEFLDDIHFRLRLYSLKLYHRANRKWRFW
jgi:hypothetical protein